MVVSCRTSVALAIGLLLALGSAAGTQAAELATVQRSAGDDGSRSQPGTPTRSPWHAGPVLATLLEVQFLPTGPELTPGCRPDPNAVRRERAIRAKHAPAMTTGSDWWTVRGW